MASNGFYGFMTSASGLEVFEIVKTFLSGRIFTFKSEKLEKFNGSSDYSSKLDKTVKCNGINGLMFEDHPGTFEIIFECRGGLLQIDTSDGYNAYPFCNAFVFFNGSLLQITQDTHGKGHPHRWTFTAD